MIEVFIVDDHKVLAQAIKDYLNAKSDISCCGMAHSGQEALDVIPNIDADVILLDIGMAQMNGIECCIQLLKIIPDLNIIGLSTHREKSVVKKLFSAGAKGYVSKATGLHEIEEAIQTVYRGDTYIGTIIQHELLSDISGGKSPKKTLSNYIPKLSKREQEVLELIAKELTTEEIGARLFISSNTVQTHRKNLITKFGVRNSVGLIIRAIDLNLI